MSHEGMIAGRYFIKDLIGQGGMADVFLAYDTILERDVAIKILRSHLASDETYVQRFAREANAVATLSHKNIIKIYDVGEDHGKYYIVMEYVPGLTLKALIRKRGALQIEEAVDIMSQLLSGVREAHRHGIIHRDLKPQNILVTDSGIAKIGDFGIAMMQSLTQVTDSTTIMGSLHYLAPEIARGEKATAQSDIYALGIIFYELLRGAVPFNDDAPVNIAIMHMRDDIPSIREFNPTISQGIENVIIKATAKNKDDRYETAGDMLYALQMAVKYPDQDKITFDQAAEDDPTMVYEGKTLEPEPVTPLKKKKKNKKALVYAGIVTALVILLVAGGLLVSSYLNARLRMPKLAGLTLDEARETLEKLELVLDEDNILEENTEQYDPGQIIKTSPAAGTEMKKGDLVRVTISKGKKITIDNYTGKNFHDAEDELVDMGFVVSTVYEESDRYNSGLVITQSLPAGTVVNDELVKEITLTVSRGYAVLVDSVIGYDIDAARKLLEYKGIKVRLEALPLPDLIDPGLETNVVVDQTHENETLTTSGVEVVLYYYPDDTNSYIPEEQP